MTVRLDFVSEIGFAGSPFEISIYRACDLGTSAIYSS